MPAAFLTRKDYDEMFELDKRYCDIANERIHRFWCYGAEFKLWCGNYIER